MEETNKTITKLNYLYPVANILARSELWYLLDAMAAC